MPASPGARKSFHCARDVRDALPDVRIGCTGWGYDDWVGPFYANGTQPADYLAAYARVFDFTEVDSTFYQSPPLERVERWAKQTPPHFTFALKLPRAITHDAKLRNVHHERDKFLDALEPLRKAGKLGPLVAQLPPSFRRSRDDEALDAFLAEWPTTHALAVELRDGSWWTDETYEAFRKHAHTLVWSTNERGRTPPVLTSPTLYARMVGDRALDATGGRWTHVQREQDDEIEEWQQRIMAAESVVRVFVVANNHFMGYAPETAQRLAQALQQKPFDLTAAGREPGQRGLRDFA